MKIPSITQIVSWQRSEMSTRADLNDCLVVEVVRQGWGCSRRRNGKGKEIEKAVAVSQEEREKPVKWESCTQWEMKSQAAWNRTSIADYILKSDLLSGLPSSTWNLIDALNYKLIIPLQFLKSFQLKNIFLTCFCFNNSSMHCLIVNINYKCAFQHFNSL